MRLFGGRVALPGALLLTKVSPVRPGGRGFGANRPNAGTTREVTRVACESAMALPLRRGGMLGRNQR